LQQYTDRLVRAGIPCLYNGMLEPTGSIAARGFALMICGGGHGLSYTAVRKAMLEARESGGLSINARQEFNSITDLLGLPQIYEVEAQYATAREG
jgi:hypothetical protein